MKAVSFPLPLFPLASTSHNPSFACFGIRSIGLIIIITIYPTLLFFFKKKLFREAQPISPQSVSSKVVTHLSRRGRWHNWRWPTVPVIRHVMHIASVIAFTTAADTSVQTTPGCERAKVHAIDCILTRTCLCCRLYVLTLGCKQFWIVCWLTESCRILYNLHRKHEDFFFMDQSTL